MQESSQFYEKTFKLPVLFLPERMKYFLLTIPVTVVYLLLLNGLLYPFLAQSEVVGIHSHHQFKEIIASGEARHVLNALLHRYHVDAIIEIHAIDIYDREIKSAGFCSAKPYICIVEVIVQDAFSV